MSKKYFIEEIMNTQKPCRFHRASSTKSGQLYFLLAILAGTSVLAFFIFRPFLYALILAIVFAVVFQPVYKKIIKFTRGRQGLAALATILIVVTFVFAPLVFLGIQIFQEAQQLYFSLADGGGKDTVLNTFNGLIDSLKKYFPAAQNLSINVNQYLKQGLGWLLQHLGSIFGSLIKTIVSFFIFLIALYYLLKDGQKLKTAVIAISPLSDADDEEISKKLGMAINSVIKGNLVIALV